MHKEIYTEGCSPHYEIIFIVSIVSWAAIERRTQWGDVWVLVNITGELTPWYQKYRQCLLYPFLPLTGADSILPYGNSLLSITVIGKKAYFGGRTKLWSSSTKARLPGLKFQTYHLLGMWPGISYFMQWNVQDWPGKDLEIVVWRTQRLNTIQLSL